MLTKAGISSDDYKRVKKIGKLDIVNSAKNSGITPEEIGFPVEEKQQITVIEKQKEEGLDTQFKVVEQSKSELEKTQTQLKIPVTQPLPAEAGRLWSRLEVAITLKRYSKR